MSEFNPSTLYSNLIGEWNFTRELQGTSPNLAVLTPRQANGNKTTKIRPLSLSGRAVFTPQKSELHYREDTKLPNHRGAPIPGHREYLYKFEGNSIRVLFFQNGKTRGDFLKLDFEDQSPMTTIGAHLCASDTYEGHFDFSCVTAPVITYSVRGPSKDYRITTRYARA